MEPVSQFELNKQAGAERFLVAFPLSRVTKRKEVEKYIKFHPRFHLGFFHYFSERAR